MTQPPDFTLRPAGNGQPAETGNTLVFTGAMLVSTMGPLDRQLRDFAEPIAQIDMAGVTAIDTVGAWICWRISRESGATVVNGGDVAMRLIGAMGRIDDGAAVAVTRRMPVWLRVPYAIGEAVVGTTLGFVAVLSFVGQIVASAGTLIAHPVRFRGRAMVHQMELIGVNALAIVGLMSFLVGIVIAQQGAVQLRQFGAEIYTVNLVGRLTLRELGILMTAIMVAGRSGSAFAAEIGTMKLTEEVDAMRTIGVAPIDVLVMPRVLATVLMMPLLGIYASVIAMIGAAFLAQFTLDIPFFTFILRIREVVPTYDIWVGLIKGPVFGLIIALAGCYQGMQVRDNAEEVGKRTTAAVVLAIFTVIVVDAFFAVFFTEIDWG